MPHQPEARRRLAALMDKRRLELRLTWQDVAEHGGVSLRALANARTGDSEIRPLTERGIETGLQWEPGSIGIILAGGDPVPLAAGPPAPQPIAAVPDLGAADVIPAMSPAMKKAAQRYHDEIAGALGVASAVEGVPAETLRGEQVFGQGTELARLWDYATDAGLALFPAGGYPVQARAWMVAIALVRRDERRAQGGEAAGLRAPAGKRRRGLAARVM